MGRCLSLLGLVALAVGVVALTRSSTPPTPETPAPMPAPSGTNRLLLLTAPVFHTRFSLN